MRHYEKYELQEFEQRICGLWEAGELPFLLHLSGGNEEELIRLFEYVQPGDWVFSGHRSHYHYLLSGGRPEDLEQMIREGKSMFVFGKPGDGAHGVTRPTGLEVNFYTSSVLAGTCGIAAGVAWQIKQEMLDGTFEASGIGSRQPHVWCFLGDGAEDEGHFYEAVRFVDGWELPCTFIIEDNRRSVETSVDQRRGPRGEGRGSNFAWPSCVKRYFYFPTYPHGGSGQRPELKAEAIQKFLTANQRK